MLFEGPAPFHCEGLLGFQADQAVVQVMLGVSLH